MSPAPVFPYPVVWMTTPESGTPHAGALLSANPGVTIHTCHSPHPHTGPARSHAWRNCDRNIRAWWKFNRDHITAPAVLFLEYDVYCNVNLAASIPTLSLDIGLRAPSILSGVKNRRTYWPFEDIPALPRSMQALACAAAPLAVLLISRFALDAILSPEYDAVFAADIFCEVRLPTVIRHAGFSVAEMNLSYVGCSAIRPVFPGIYHPVKSPVQ